MIAMLLLAALAADPPVSPLTSIDGLPIGALARQQLPAKGCAAYLFSTGQTRVLVAMAGADPATLRLSLGGTTTDYARASASGDAGFGLATSAVYRGGDVTATLDLTIAERRDITAGALVREATLRIDRTGADTIVLPVAGLVGCAA